MFSQQALSLPGFNRFLPMFLVNFVKPPKYEMARIKGQYGNKRRLVDLFISAHGNISAGITSPLLYVLVPFIQPTNRYM